MVGGVGSFEGWWGSLRKEAREKSRVVDKRRGRRGRRDIVDFKVRRELLSCKSEQGVSR